MRYWFICCSHRYTRVIPEPALFLSWHGAQLGSLRVFSVINKRGSTGAYVTRIYCRLSVKINMGKTLHGMRSLWTHLFWVCFCMRGRQKPTIPKLSAMADNAITRGRIRGLESPFYICGCSTSDWALLAYLFNFFNVIINPYFKFQLK